MGESVKIGWRVPCFLAAVLAWGPVARAHSGGTDANGCHTDSSTGGRHCHGKGGGGEPRSGLAGGLFLLTATIAGMGAWGSGSMVDGSCARVPSGKTCPAKALAWVLTATTAVAVIGSFYFLAPSSQDESGMHQATPIGLSLSF